MWQHDLDSATQAENNNYISKAAPTPAVDSTGVVCFFEGGNLLLPTHDGKVRWQRNLVEEFGSIESRHGISESLEQAGDRVFVWVERSKEPYVLAILSFGLWTYLVVQAWRARMDLHPQLFTAAHRRRGYWVFAGTVFTAVSGVWLYWLGFVA